MGHFDTAVGKKWKENIFFAELLKSVEVPVCFPDKMDTLLTKIKDLNWICGSVLYSSSRHEYLMGVKVVYPLVALIQMFHAEGGAWQ